MAELRTVVGFLSYKVCRLAFRLNLTRDAITLAESLCTSVTSYPTPDPLQGQASLEFYGQRPWRPGKQEPPDLAKGREGVVALQYREGTRTRHSQTILELLRLSSEQFSLFNCLKVGDQAQSADGGRADGRTELIRFPCYTAILSPGFITVRGSRACCQPS